MISWLCIVISYTLIIIMIVTLLHIVISQTMISQCNI